MATLKLTQRVAETAKPADKPYQLHDVLIPGLVLRVQPTGRKFWKLIQDRKPHSLGQFPTMSHAMAAEHAKAILRGDVAQPQHEARTFGGYLDRYYEPWALAHRKSGAAIVARLRSFPFLDHELTGINAAEVERWRTQRRNAGKAIGTLNRDLVAVKAALQRAVEWDLLPANPLMRVKPLRGDTKGVVRYLGREEESRLYTALESAEPFLRALVVLSLNTGLRRGELFSLTWGDVDLKRRQATLRGEGAKSGQTRHVPLNQTAAKAMRRWRGDVVPIPTSPVFPRREFKKSWVTLLRRADVEAFRFHDCRHHFASKLVMAGVDLNTVRDLLGHADIKMTLRYAHLAPEHKQAAVDLIG